MMGPIAENVTLWINNSTLSKMMGRVVLFSLGYRKMELDSYYRAVSEAVKATRRDENVPATRPRRFEHELGITYVLMRCSGYNDVIGLYSSLALAKGAAKLEALPALLTPFVEYPSPDGSPYHDALSSRFDLFRIMERRIDTKWVPQ